MGLFAPMLMILRAVTYVLVFLKKFPNASTSVECPDNRILILPIVYLLGLATKRPLPSRSITKSARGAIDKLRILRRSGFLTDAGNSDGNNS